MTSELQEIARLVKILEASKTRAELTLQTYQRSIRDIEREIIFLEEDIEVIEKTKATFKHLFDTMVLDGVKKIESLLTYGLSTVFENQKLSVKIEVSEKRGYVNMDLLLCDNTYGRNVEAPIIGNFGGGPVAIISFLLRVLSLINLKLERVLILDEPFSIGPSENYLPRASQLVKAISEKLGIDILIITRQVEVAEAADAVYSAKSSPEGLVITDVTMPKDRC